MNIDEAAEIAYGPNWKENLKDRRTIDALKTARQYVRTIEAWRNRGVLDEELVGIIKDFTDGNEEKIINDALLEFGIIF